MNYDKAPNCDCSIIHEDLVVEARESMVEEELLYDVADFFKAMGDSTRLKIITVLNEREMCVCDLANVLNMKQSAISHQLRVLKSFKLVKYRREGKVVYYSVDDHHVSEILDIGIVHVKGQ